jgi:alpha-ribazole phosphatase
MSTAAARLWLVRHAQPLIAPGICYGQLDVAAQLADTQAAAQALATALPLRVGALWHSPLQRCELLSTTLQELRADLTAKPEPRIAELDFGCWEGRAWETIGRAEIDAWSADFFHHAPGGGESLQAMLQRVGQALEDAASLAARHQLADLVWITHAGVARCVQWLLAHGPQRQPLAAEWPREAPAFGAWTVVELP